VLHPSSLQRNPHTPHSSGFARLEFEAFYEAIEYRLFTRPLIFDINYHSKKHLSMINSETLEKIFLLF
jgi:hypothetical protein